jgi:dihydropyrimidinase
MVATLIKNGRIVTAVDDYMADILVSNGHVETIGRNLAVGADVEVHDAAGLLVLPGGIDVHTHLDWEFGPTHTVDTFGTHGGKIEEHGFHSVNGLSFAAVSANDDR